MSKRGQAPSVASSSGNQQAAPKTTPKPTPTQKPPQKQTPAKSEGACQSHGCGKCWLWTLSLLVVLVAVFAGLNHYATHVFDPAVMQQIAKDSIAKHPNDLALQLKFVEDSLRAAYPKHIIDKPEWMFNNAGGAMGAMLILHCSISEYVIIFGTPVGTEGHSGRFFADDYFTILHGEQWAFSPGQLHREIYRAGDQHHLPWLTSKQYRMDESCWALEYARGSIPSMLPFGLWDTLFSTLDIPTFAQTVRVSATGMFQQLLLGKI